jgi:hypothetical protein
MGLDLDEHDLTESERSLKRLGITHVWRQPCARQSPAPDQSCVSLPSADAATSSAAQPQSDRPPVIPPLLRALFHGKQSPVASLWTYNGLNEDLRHPEPPGRLAIFRKIQETVRTHLHWREQDICSWPLDIAPELFRAGLETFRPRLIISLGSTDSQPLLSSLDPSRIRRLPDIDAMARGDRDAKNEAWKILRSITQEFFPS